LSFYRRQTVSTTYAFQFDSYIVDVYGKPLLLLRRAPGGAVHLTG